MSLYSDAIRAIFTRASVRRAYGAAFYFTSGTRRLIYGSGTRFDPDGNKWEGISVLVGIEGLTIGIGPRTQPLRLTISGLDASLMTIAQGQSSQSRGTYVEIFEHFFADDWSYVGKPVSIAMYTLDKITPNFDGQKRVAALDVNCEPLTVSSWRAPNAYLDHRSQQARAPGDKGLSFMAKYVVAQSLGMW